MVMMMVVVMMMVSRISEHRGSEHHQQQCGGEYLLHGTNLARRLPGRKSTEHPAPRQERAGGWASTQNPA
jgi:hypothetical protein